MTAKEFFKSTTFRCLVTLLCVLLVCGVFLTIMNGLLAISEEEKFQRVLSSIYGKNVTTEKQNISDKNTDLATAKINDVYLVTDDGNYIVNVSGKNGYGGNVLCWVVIKPAADKKSVGGVGNVQVPATGNEGESFLNKINSSVFKRFEQDYKNGIVYEYGYDENDAEGDMYIKTGASCTMRGVSNAVNGTIQFMNAYLSGGSIEEDDPYEDYAYHKLINMESTSWTKDGDKITYTVVTKKNGPANPFTFTIVINGEKKVEEFTVKTYGSTDSTGYDLTIEEYNAIVDANVAKFIGKDAAYFASILGEDETKAKNDKYEENELQTGATKSTTLCLAAAAFATSNYDLIMNAIEYKQKIDLEKTTWTVDGDKITYNVVTLKNAPADPFTFTIVVNGEKKIEEFTVKTYGSTDSTGYDLTIEEYNAIVDANVAKFIGKDAAYFAAIITDEMKGTNANFAENELQTGATKSTYLCLLAGAFATSNYDYCLTHVNGGESNE